MSAFPISVNADAISALVVGGGAVATRKALALLAAGARVRVIAPAVSDELVARERDDENLAIVRRDYAGPRDIANAALVIAATSSKSVNARVSADAHDASRLVNVVDAPGTGTFTTMAVHRTGDVTIGVSTGSVPSAAQRIRDSIAARIDARYADAIAACAALRARTLKPDGSGTEIWADVHPRLISEDFCGSVEDGSFAVKVDRCR